MVGPGRSQLSLWMKALAVAIALNGSAVAATVDPAKADKGESARTAPGAKSEKGEAPKSENAKADENRRKPLQRCDELKDKAQLECLRKARERIVEARAKREAKGEKK